MAHVINFNNVDKVYLSEQGDGVTITFSCGQAIPYSGIEARQIRTTLNALVTRQSGWFHITEED